MKNFGDTWLSIGVIKAFDFDKLSWFFGLTDIMYSGIVSKIFSNLSSNLSFCSVTVKIYIIYKNFFFQFTKYILIFNFVCSTISIIV